MKGYGKREAKRREGIRELRKHIKEVKEQLRAEGIYIHDMDLCDDYKDLELKYSMLLLEYEKLKKQSEGNNYTKGYDKGYWEGFRDGNKHNRPNIFSTSSINSYTEVEKKLLKEGFKLLAMKHHPDKGGDNETMSAINNLKEKIL